MEFKIRDIYGDEFVYNCDSEEEAREYFDIENGEDRFSEFIGDELQEIVKGKINKNKNGK